MSMINDALKRAKATQPKNDAPAAPPMRAAEGSPARSARSELLLPILIGIILVLAALLLWQWFLGAVKVRANTLPDIEAAQPAPKIIAAPVEKISMVSATPTNLAVAPAKPLAPAFRLQSIFYLPKNPSAMINGKSVSVGGFVNAARVLAIGKNSATILTAGGEKKVLTLAGAD